MISLVVLPQPSLKFGIFAFAGAVLFSGSLLGWVYHLRTVRYAEPWEAWYQALVRVEGDVDADAPAALFQSHMTDAQSEKRRFTDETSSWAGNRRSAELLSAAHRDLLTILPDVRGARQRADEDLRQARAAFDASD